MRPFWDNPEISRYISDFHYQLSALEARRVALKLKLSDLIAIAYPYDDLPEEIAVAVAVAAGAGAGDVTNSQDRRRPEKPKANKANKKKKAKQPAATPPPAAPVVLTHADMLAAEEAFQAEIVNFMVLPDNITECDRLMHTLQGMNELWDGRLGRLQAAGAPQQTVKIAERVN